MAMRLLYSIKIWGCRRNTDTPKARLAVLPDGAAEDDFHRAANPVAPRGIPETPGRDDSEPS
jgi:hypothetical protein